MEELKKLLEFTNIDVERLVDDYTNTLKRNNNPFATREGTIITLKEFAREKNWLLHQIVAMPGYNGNLQSVGNINVPYERTRNDTTIAVRSIWDNLFEGGHKILSKKDSSGKTVEDYIKEELQDMPDKIRITNLSKYSGKSSKTYSDFSYDGYTIESIKKKQAATKLINAFCSYTASRLTAEMAATINEICPEIRAAADMKTTRALGKMIKIYGLEDKTAGSVYTRTYIAKYCEIMKEGGLNFEFVLSGNPIDYLKMSIGEFTSCHNINDGGWRSGTISYMLDKVTMVGYTIRPNSETEPDPETGEIFLGKDRPELFLKVHRNLFHWDELYRLVQSRVYPQSFDGVMDIRAVFRHEAQARIAKANGWDPDNWTNRKSKHMEFTVDGEGHTNYSDWSYGYMGANLSTPGHTSDSYSTAPLVIGAKPICVICGRKHSRTNRMYCENCR